jgi:hypothetical protein
VKVPTNRKGEIIQPVDTDSIVLGICNKDPGISLWVIASWHCLTFSRCGLMLSSTNFKILGVIDSITFSLIMGMIDSKSRNSIVEEPV